MANKTEFHLFLLPDYEEEETYLNKMAKKGYHLDHINLPGIYHITKSQPKDMVYKIDFNPQKRENWNSYLQMYKDYGWEYVQDLNQFSYFRKTATESESDMEIFNDNSSKLDMIWRIFQRKMLPFLVIFLCAVIPNFFREITAYPTTSFSATMLVIWSVLLVLYVYIITRCAVGFSRLKKKYQSLD